MVQRVQSVRSTRIRGIQALMLACALSACGGGGSDGDAPPAPTPAPAPAPTPAPTPTPAPPPSAPDHLVLRSGNTSFTGNLDGPSAQAYFNLPMGVATGADGALYVADSENGLIRKLQADGTVSTFAGERGAKNRTDGPLAQARFTAPNALAAARDGSLYVNDGGLLRRIAPDGMVSSHAFPDGTTILALVEAPQGGVYVALNGAVFHFAPGTGFDRYAGQLHDRGAVDGPRLDARLDWVRSLAVDPAGNLYAAEEDAGTVRRISVDGQVSTIGGARWPFPVDGPAAGARFTSPRRLAAHPSGEVWLLDGAKTIRRIAADGSVSSPYPWASELLADAQAHAIASTASGELLALHPRGILVLRPDGSHASLAGQAPPPSAAVASQLALLGGVDAAGNTTVLVQTPAGPVLRKVSATGDTVPFGQQAEVALPSRSTLPGVGGSWEFNRIQRDAAGNLLIAAGVRPDFVITGLRFVAGALFLVTPEGQLSRVAQWQSPERVRVPRAMAVDAQWVYFVDALSGDVLRWDRGSGVQEVVMTYAQYRDHEPNAARPQSGPDALVLREGVLHMLRDGAVEKIVDGRVQTVLPFGSLQRATDLAVAEDGSLYLADQEVVWKIADGGVPQVLAGTRGLTGLRLRTAPGVLLPVSSLAVERGGRVHLLSGAALLTATSP